MPNSLIAPNRDEPFVNEDGVSTRRPQKWIEEVNRYINENQDGIGGLGERLTVVEIRSKTNTVITWLSPHF